MINSKGLFNFRLKLDDQKIIDMDYEDFDGIEKIVKELKKKFR